MKKTLASLLLFSWSLTLFAQTDKGSFLIGGNGSISLNKTDYNPTESKTASFSISPVAGYFFINNFCTGLGLPLSSSWSKVYDSNGDEDYKARQASYSVSPFVRYYFPVRSFFVVAEGAFSWVQTKSKYPQFDFNTGQIIGDINSTSNDTSYRLAAGPAFFFNRHTSIEILLNYENLNGQYTDNSDLFISIGFQIFLPSDKE